MPANINYKPKAFDWNSKNIKWLKSYLLQKNRLLNKITSDVGVDIANINLLQFDSLCELLEKTAEGRELRTKMFKAWRSKKSRDSNNGKKIFTFNLDVQAGAQLKKLAHDRPLNKTLEDLIYGTFQSVESLRLETKQLKIQQKAEAEEIKEQQAEEEVALRYDVKSLGSQEKSELIRIILKLNRELSAKNDAYQEKDKALTMLKQEFDALCH